MEALRVLMKQDDTVLFIGSGISRWSGLPTWGGMIDQLEQYVHKNGGSVTLLRAEVARGDLLQAASYGFDQLSAHQIGEFVRQATRMGVAKPHDIHRHIVSLGPRSFITTNYDALIEDALKLWHPDRFVRSAITNRHLTECAEIIGSRAKDFVFKPHGDVSDSQSIILTREQYRQLLPGGEKSNALEALKMLLATRPVVYLGFGLRDPDFVYLRDLLANTFKGGTRDHYAIMADVEGGEVTYWRKNYGIHLVGYQTSQGINGDRDHSELLELLASVSVKGDDSLASKPLKLASMPSAVLALARHAARFSRVPKVEGEFPIYVNYSGELNARGKGKALKLPYRAPIDRFLDNGQRRVALTGSPGAGKTYAVKRSVARLAAKLSDLCIDEGLQSTPTVPVYIDMRLYQGDIWRMAEEALPVGLSLEELIQECELRFYIDSFNEMPRDQQERGAYKADISEFLARIGQASVFISSRTNDGLDEFDLVPYSLDEIDEDFVLERLASKGVTLGGPFLRELVGLLKKPFYFSLALSGRIEVSSNCEPRSIYQSLFSRLEQEFKSRFGVDFSISSTLSSVAYQAINDGEEAQSAAEVVRTLRVHRQSGASQDSVSSEEILNWLIYKGVLLPLSGGRVAFFHQSVTEYLAATELARLYVLNQGVARSKIAMRRWDQALFLTISLLEAGSSFFADIVETDLLLAINASKYVEVGRDEVVSIILDSLTSRLGKDSEFEIGAAFALKRDLLVSRVHEGRLRALLDHGNAIGGVASLLLARLNGVAFKEELFELLIERRDDFNFCYIGLADAIELVTQDEDLPRLIGLLDSEDDEPEGKSALIDCLARVVEEFDFAEVVRCAGSNSSGRRKFLCRLARDVQNLEGVKVAAQLLLDGEEEAATALYFIGAFGGLGDEMWSSLDERHADRLIEMMVEVESSRWALGVMRMLCASRRDIAEAVQHKAASMTGLACAALRYASSHESDDVLISELTRMSYMSFEEIDGEPIELLKKIGIRWNNHKPLLARLLRLRHTRLASALLEELRLEAVVEDFEIDDVAWWLDWIEEDVRNGGTWFAYCMSGFFGHSLASSSLEAMLREFNRTDGVHRGVLARYVLLRMVDLTTNDFSEDAISYLLANLRSTDALPIFDGHLLGVSATEQFARERLVPLLAEPDETFATNVRKVLEQAGRRHGRRYFA